VIYQPIGELINSKPSRIDFFESHGFDFYTRGTQTLEDAAKEMGVNVETVNNELIEFDRSHATRSEPDWNNITLHELIDNIITVHHARMRKELPELFDLAEEVSKTYGIEHPEIIQVEKLFGAFRFALEAHMITEERVLFRTIRMLESGETHWQGDSNPAGQIKVKIREHDSSADDLRQIRKLTNNYTPPEDTGESYRRFLRSIEAIEHDVHLHMHKENNILFPRASKLAMEHVRGGSWE